MSGHVCTDTAVMFLMTVLGTEPTPLQDGLLNKRLPFPRQAVSAYPG